MPSKSTDVKIQKEMEKYKLKFSDEEYKAQLIEIQNRINVLKDKPKPQYKDEIWINIYEDVLELKKKSKKYFFSLFFLLFWLGSIYLFKLKNID